MEKNKKKKFKMTAPLFIILTFLVVIGIGTICLSMPFATSDGEPLEFVDALFVATSATCVTGLSTIACGIKLSLFGQIVLASLIEIGGLSFLTIVSFIMLMLGKKIDVRYRMLMKEQLNQSNASGIKHLIINIVEVALSIQFIGAIACFFVFRFGGYGYDTPTAIKLGIFHSISSFNNAGFDLFGESSMMNFRHDYLLNFITMILIILGGLGFVVMREVVAKRKWRKFSLHTKVVIIMTLVLTLGGALLFKLFMWSELNLVDSLFCSVTARTAGFTTIDMKSLNGPAYLLMCFLMFIGASPGSTGGGFKTTSFFVLILTLVAFSRGSSPHAFKRKISRQQMEKMFALFTMEITYIIGASCILAYTEHLAGSDLTVSQLVFETISAFATVGLSQDTTMFLHEVSKFVIIVTMFIGRLGPLTIISIWNNRKNALVERDIKYVEGNIIIG